MNVIPKDNNDYTKYEQAVYDMWNYLENSEKRPVKWIKNVQLPLANLYDDNLISLDHLLSLNDFCGETPHCKFGFDKSTKGFVVKRDIKKNKFLNGINKRLNTIYLKWHQ